MSINEKPHFPFICLIIPFVGTGNAFIRPLIRSKRPLVGIGQYSSGFTLIELMITLVVAAVLLSIGAPSFSQFLASNRLTTQINNFAGALNTARSVAVTRNTSAGVCTTNGGASCTVGPWQNGWLVFYLCTAQHGAAYCTAGTNVPLTIHEPLSGGNTLTGPATTISYNNLGLVTAGGSADYTLCDLRSGKTRIVTVNNTGRPSISEGTCP